MTVELPRSIYRFDLQNLTLLLNNPLNTQLIHITTNIKTLVLLLLLLLLLLLYYYTTNHHLCHIITH